MENNKINYTHTHTQRNLQLWNGAQELHVKFGLNLKIFTSHCLWLPHQPPPPNLLAPTDNLVAREGFLSLESEGKSLPIFYLFCNKATCKLREHLTCPQSFLHIPEVGSSPTLHPRKEKEGGKTIRGVFLLAQKIPLLLRSPTLRKREPSLQSPFQFAENLKEWK